MRTSERSKRLTGILDKKIPTILQQLFTPDEVGFLTVTIIESSGDLGVVDVFVRSIGGPSGWLKMLNKSAKRVSDAVAKEVNLRRFLRIRFKLDKSVEYSQKVNQKLSENVAT